MLTLISVPSLPHTFPDHPEIPERVTAALAAIEASPVASRIARAPALPASPKQIAAVHTPGYLAALERAMEEAPGYIEPAPTYITPESFECARLAAGGAIGAVETALGTRPRPQSSTSESNHSEAAESQAAFALIRPPGHHALPDSAMGFCLFNNIAIAARHAQARGAAKIMIVDIDVHHGNGTQAAFYSDPSVLFLSTHQGGLYPNSGWEHETGQGAGLGYTLNMPLPAGAGDQTFERLCAEIIVPAADGFAPDFLLVSAGYDAHWRDPLGSLQLSAQGYGKIVCSLREIALRHCGGRMALVLEGGYDLPALSTSVVASLHALLGDSAWPDPLGPAPRAEPDVKPLIRRWVALHQL